MLGFRQRGNAVESRQNEKSEKEWRREMKTKANESFETASADEWRFSFLHFVKLRWKRCALHSIVIPLFVFIFIVILVTFVLHGLGSALQSAGQHGRHRVLDGWSDRRSVAVVKNNLKAFHKNVLLHGHKRMSVGALQSHSPAGNAS